MKKFFMIAVMAFSAITASAQLQQAGTFSIMPKVGIGYDFFTDSQYQDLVKLLSDNKIVKEKLNGDIGLSAGIEAQYMVSNSFGISLGLEYQHYNTELVKQSSESDKIYWKDGWSLGYINVPILAQYHIGHFAIKAGVQPAFLVLSEYGEKKVSEGLNTFAFSIPVGVSYEFKRPFVLGLQYNIPCTKLNKDGDLNVKTSAIQLTFGYRINL